jgi:superfamily II DNA or RNA helicase/HKD family nuclease
MPVSDPPEGLYDLLLTESLARRLDPRDARIDTLGSDSHERLAEVLSEQLGKILGDLGGDDEERLHRQLGLVNALLVDLRQRLRRSAHAKAAALIDPIRTPPRRLTAVNRRGLDPAGPDTGLNAPWLFTAGKGSPALLHELRRELSSCDGVDILVSFITVTGVRRLVDALQRITAVGADGRPATPIRILTTTYIGATDAEAVDQLAALPGCEVRVSLDGRRTRLHAKAWIFHRRTGFGSVYVGSANLSGAALTGGLEWTIKLAERTQQALFARAVAHFETLWQDPEFQPYDPARVEHRRALRQALRRETGEPVLARTTFFELQPKTYQQEMLEQLDAERAHGRRRNLVVAATGTGKTVVAAFDYRNTCRAVGGQPRLLFVAHREEILRQAMRTFREVLRNGSFGELLLGGSQPESFDHLFATIDSVTSRRLVAQLGAEHWHTVIVDECHRLAAERFDAFAGAVRPKMLLGLTATPERADGKPIGAYFDARPDGSPAVELRLWHALDLQLLAPFEYFAIDDETDFSEVPWERPGEQQAIDKLVTGNQVRARLVVNEWRRLTARPRQSRALVFCVSVAHARFMADFLNHAGLPAACVVGTTPVDERRRAPQRLANGDLCALVTVDLYNEGIDLPAVDTLLLLRPTQSPVLFQQQIGRGLRLAPDKESCLVLDFVGQHRADFRFDRLLSSLTGLSRRQLEAAIEHGFGQLPPGCHIQLQRQTREQVLRSLRTLTGQGRWRWMRAELQAFAALRGRHDIGLADFLHEQALESGDVYRKQGRSGWTQLKRDAGLLDDEAGPEDAYFGNRFAGLLHMDDPEAIALLRRVGEAAAVRQPGSDTEAMRLQMLTYQIDGQSKQVGSYRAFLDRLGDNPSSCQELAELAQVLESQSNLVYRPVPGLEDCPLCLHAAYRIREILTAVGWLTAERRVPFQAGTLPLKHRNTELFFVTLDKSDGYHDRIAYRDYAISDTLFHWESQNSAGPDTPVGRRYLDSRDNGWSFQLFVRPTRAQPYRACGPLYLESAEGDRPLSIVWRLAVPLPAQLFAEFSVLRGA